MRMVSNNCNVLDIKSKAEVLSSASKEVGGGYSTDDSKDNITLQEGRTPTLIKTYKYGGMGDCRGYNLCSKRPRKSSGTTK